MNKDMIIQLARQAEGEEQQHGMWRMHLEDLQRFAALVAAVERDTCANLAILAPRPEGEYDSWRNAIANAIRNRT